MPNCRLIRLTAFITALVAAPLLMGSGDANASDATDQGWSYKDWSVGTDAGDISVGTPVTCTMQADDILEMMISHRKHDAALPVISFFKGLGEDGQPMAVSDGDLKTTWFFDGQAGIKVTLGWDFRDSRNYFPVPAENALELMAAMSKGETLVLETSFIGDETISLAGFAAVYGKMADWCDFSTDGVLPAG